jgi:acyl carrier protein
MATVSNNNSGSIGGPIANFQSYVLSDKKKLLPSGSIGELYIGGVGLARGYLNQVELTESQFVMQELENCEIIRIYRTGDLVRWTNNGQLEFIGRTDHQIKLRGFRIELEEIETVLAAIENIDQALVVSVKREDGTLAIAAYYTKQKDLSTDYIKRALQEKLPEYMVPSAFMPVSQFPLTSNGKIDRESLPTVKFSTHSTEFVAPRTDVQKKLCKIWQDVLKVELIGIKEDFFDLGGHSLMVTNIIVRVQAEFDVDILVKDMFAAPSIERLAELVEVELKLKNMLAVSEDNEEDELWEV